MLRTAIVAVLSFALAAVMLVAPSVPGVPGADEEPAAAADLSKFDPSNIISDAVFFNSGTMTQGQIQNFLASKAASCSGVTCIKDYRQTTTSRAADSYCKAYTGASNELASAIIYKVSQACGINPRVLITTLQKEQGLITSGASTSSARWKIAMGYACPDTAACDTRYYGFANQVYSAARQFKVYAYSGYFTWFPVGKASSVQYHPNAACGSSRLTIKNKATAALYYYTPYQPNAAALAAGYGASSNSCAAYGNRNFYNYFTDWFGSTGGGNSSSGNGVTSHLIQATGQNEVYLVNGKTKFHVDSKANYNVLKSKLGAAQKVSVATVNGYTTSTKKATLVLRNGTGDDVVLIDNGQYHRFTSCAQVALWGTSCANAANAAPAALAKFGKGADVAPFVRTPSSSNVYWIKGNTTAYWTKNSQANSALNGGKAPYVATLPDARLKKLTVSSQRVLAPHSLVKTSGSSQLWYVNGLGSRHRVAHASVAAEHGASTTVTTVSDAELKPYKAGANLGLLVGCGGTEYVGSRGTLVPVGSAAKGGLPSAVTLDGLNCALTKKDTKKLTTATVFVQDTSNNRVYVPQSGQWRWSRNADMHATLNNGSAPRVLKVAGTTRTSVLATGPTAIVPGNLYKQDGDSIVYLVTDAKTRYRLPVWGMANDYGLARTSHLVAPSTLSAASYTKKDAGLFVRCGSTNYIMNGGKATKVQKVPAGFTPITLSSGFCSSITTSGSVSGRVFVKASGTGKVYELVNGKARWITTRAKLEKLNGGSWPTVLSIHADSLRVMPKGPNY
ncbi:hemagglutinin-related protein [Mycetocola reblochoni REB411]|uniref:Hemagglutinin-related protein n=1 Tax=Mycetocola reblochoni REB411 TaxID=1255698 RepID=A0A1R4K0T0_9MICO|nr:hemagglutinin-related protein [Mycetocola reblochoni REB411]